MKLIIAIAMVFGLCMLAAEPLNNDTNVKLHEIGAVSNDLGDLKVFKMIHAGCEIFVAQGHWGSGGNTPVAITTGRGCK